MPSLTWYLSKHLKEVDSKPCGCCGGAIQAEEMVGTRTVGRGRKGHVLGIARRPEWQERIEQHSLIS